LYQNIINEIDKELVNIWKSYFYITQVLTIQST
jgi:hypothetical protein